MPVGKYRDPGTGNWLKLPGGPAGPTGPTGAAGANGATGAQGPPGPSEPSAGGFNSITKGGDNLLYLHAPGQVRGYNYNTNTHGAIAAAAVEIAGTRVNFAAFQGRRVLVLATCSMYKNAGDSTSVVVFQLKWDNGVAAAGWTHTMQAPSELCASLMTVADLSGAPPPGTPRWVALYAYTVSGWLNATERSVAVFDVG